jgi:acyl carrier protein phosphodiesterase
VKGNSYQTNTKRIAECILMHRFIDDFTDTHSLVKECNALLREGLGRYAPVALDVFFDYFLANNFHQYHHLSLEDFTRNSYQVFYQNYDLLPFRNQEMLPYMSQQNWLLNYAKIDGIKKALAGMAQRSKYGAIMKGGEKFLIEHEEKLKANFELFFKELQKNTEDYKSRLK